MNRDDRHRLVCLWIVWEEVVACWNCFVNVWNDVLFGPFPNVPTFHAPIRHASWDDAWCVPIGNGGMNVSDK